VIPVTQTREMESVLKVGSGQTAVLGGLMLDSFEGKREGLPLASRIPIFGDLVSNRNDQATKSELVIFIRPVVIRDASVEGDLAEYRRYLPDREFFKDTRPPLPEFQEGMRKLERGELPRGKPNPVVPDVLAPSAGGQP
jgi:general secretion pathway protein D